MKLTRGNSFNLGFEYDHHILRCPTAIPKEPEKRPFAESVSDVNGNASCQYFLNSLTSNSVIMWQKVKLKIPVDNTQKQA